MGDLHRHDYDQAVATLDQTSWCQRVGTRCYNSVIGLNALAGRGIAPKKRTYR